jgi:hypothetical protein
MYYLRPRHNVKYNYEEDNIIDDLQLANNYYDKIFQETKNKNPKLISDNTTIKLYFIRIWIKWSDKYFYKIGSATNIYSRMKQIDSTYGCYGKIVIIVLAEIPNQILEKDIHRKLINYQITERNIVNPIKPAPKELYYIDGLLWHNLMLILYNNIQVKNIFETSNYLILYNSENINKKNGTKSNTKKNSDYQEKLINENIILDQNINEIKYWNKMRLV